MQVYDDTCREPVLRCSGATKQMETLKSMLPCGSCGQQCASCCTAIAVRSVPLQVTSCLVGVGYCGFCPTRRSAVTLASFLKDELGRTLGGLLVSVW